jgi:hypothetical protein
MLRHRLLPAVGIRPHYEREYFRRGQVGVQQDVRQPTGQSAEHLSVSRAGRQHRITPVEQIPHDGDPGWLRLNIAQHVEGVFPELHIAPIVLHGIHEPTTHRRILRRQIGYLRP